jgi:putative ABC transport system permease protein
MLLSYIKIAVRNLRRNPLISFIHVFGLGLSMTVGLMVMIRLQDQLGYDRFHPYPDRTYRITSEYQKRTGEHWRMASTPLPLEAALESQSAHIEAMTTVYPSFGGNATAGGKTLSLSGAFTEPSFFTIFGFRLAVGNPMTALQQPHALVLSKTAAARFFGDVNPLGKILTFDKGVSYIVTGVLGDPPGKSHLDFDAYAPLSGVPQLEREKALPQRSDDWYAFNAAYTYVLLKKGSKASSLLPILASVSATINKPNPEGTAAFHLQRLTDITPAAGDLNNEIGRGSSWTKVYFEMGVAFLLLLAACFNYTNLTIARALTRAKEVGMRKIAGAWRYQVFVQYIVESVVLALLALGFAWIVLAPIITYAPFNDGYEFIPSSFAYNGPLLAWSVAFALCTGLLAGAAPAWILSAFKPLRVLKNLSTAKIMGKVSLQKALIVFQYSLSLFILIFLTAFYRQFSFMSSADQGFHRDNMLVIPLAGADESLITQRVGGLSGVEAVSAMSDRFEGRFSGMGLSAWLDGKEHPVNMNYYHASPEFIPGMDLTLVAGHNFLRTGDSSTEREVLLNEKAVHALGVADPSNIIGQRLWINDSTHLSVAGVVKDFNYENVGRPISPLAFRSKKGAYNYVYVRVNPIDKEATTARIGAAWAALYPAKAFTYSWLDEDLERANSQKATLSLLGYLAFMAASIATLGLLGLVMYTVEVRRKEISIRKIVGAEKREVVQLLSKGFVRLLLLSGLIAVPLGYTAGYLFRQLFARQAPFGPQYALACFGALLLIGLVTIGSQTYRAAGENPARNLRTE